MNTYYPYALSNEESLEHLQKTGHPAVHWEPNDPEPLLQLVLMSCLLETHAHS
jgi:hypothetical protein